MNEKIITCITCPIGCRIFIRSEGETILQMEGNQCKRGAEYARIEYVHPVRVLTTTVRIKESDCPLLPVRSDKPIPKELLMQCMDEIKNVCVKAPIARYSVVIPNILDTGANIVAAGEAV